MRHQLEMSKFQINFYLERRRLTRLNRGQNLERNVLEGNLRKPRWTSVVDARRFSALVETGLEDARESVRQFRFRRRRR
jgi:hypothetical protein